MDMIDMQMGFCVNVYLFLINISTFLYKKAHMWLLQGIMLWINNIAKRPSAYSCIFLSFTPLIYLQFVQHEPCTCTSAFTHKYTVDDHFPCLFCRRASVFVRSSFRFRRRKMSTIACNNPIKSPPFYLYIGFSFVVFIQTSIYPL